MPAKLIHICNRCGTIINGEPEEIPNLNAIRALTNNPGLTICEQCYQQLMLVLESYFDFETQSVSIEQAIKSKVKIFDKILDLWTGGNA